MNPLTIKEPPCPECGQPYIRKDDPVYKAVERILDENSAWIARPSPEVTRQIALAATIAAQCVLQEISRQDQRDLSEIEARVRPTICPTWSSDGGDQGSQGRISEDDFNTPPPPYRHRRMGCGQRWRSWRRQ